jgi:ABC-type transporter Mla subunit MlaD
MESRGTFVRVGLLLLVGAAVLIGLVLFLAGGQFGGGKLLESYFSESVQGLNVGGPVKYRGVNVGTITDIGLTGAEYGKGMLAEELDNPQYQLVFVRYRINFNRVGSLPDIADSVKAGIRARLSTQGLTGLSYIEIDFVPGAAVPPPPPWQPHAEVIPSVPSTFAQVEDVATQLAQRLSKLDIEALVNNLIGLTADLRTDLKSGDVHDAIDSVNQLLSSVQDAVKQADVPRLTGELRRTAAAMTKLADGKATQDTLASASVAANRLAEAAAKLPALIAALQATAQRADTTTSDLTSDLAPILRDAAAAMANLRDTTAALRRDPGQVLFGGPPPHAAQGDSR